MDGDYLFSGLALVENDLLRTDEMTVYLPYVGYGYAHRFGRTNGWVFDSRIGVGPTLNADANAVYPIMKTGIGKIF